MSENRFGVYTHQIVDEKNRLYLRHFIVLKDDIAIVGWTDFHKYIKPFKSKRTIPIESDSKKRFLYVCMFLNYCFFDKYKVDKATDITMEMVENFLQDYALCRLPDDDEYTHRNTQSVDQCIMFVLDFVDLFCRKNPNSKIKPQMLFKEEEVFSQIKGEFISKKVPIINIAVKDDGQSEILRDMPEEAFQILMTVIAEKHRNILMVAALGAFGGLRASEALNVRRLDSPIGSGMLFEYINDRLSGIEIDLTHEYNLRSDYKSVGKIKRHRKAQIYPHFYSVFAQCYDLYMDFIEGKPYEVEYGALTNTKSGKAMSYASYYAEFQKAVEDAKPIFKASSDPNTVKFGLELDTKKIAPHIFRHYFTVKLVLMGENEATIQTYRGDKSVSSALNYLQNKGEIQKQYKKVVDETAGYVMWKAEKLNELTERN